MMSCADFSPHNESITTKYVYCAKNGFMSVSLCTVTSCLWFIASNMVVLSPLFVGSVMCCEGDGYFRLLGRQCFLVAIVDVCLPVATANLLQVTHSVIGFYRLVNSNTCCCCWPTHLWSSCCSGI